MEDFSVNNKHADGGQLATLRDCVTIMFRHQRLIAISFLGILMGSTFVALLQPDRYQAGMKILVKRERADPVVTTDASTVPQVSVGVTEEEVNSEVELLKSRDLLENVVRTCGLQDLISSPSTKVVASIHNGGEASEPDKPVANAVRRLQKQLDVDVVKKTNLIAVNYESSDPKLAAHVLSTLANLYLEKHLAVHRPPGAFDFFQHETEAYRKELADAESRLVDFGHNTKTVSPQLEKEATLQKLGEFDATLKQTGAAVVETQQRIRVLQEQSASIPSRMVTQIRNSDDAALLSQLRSNLLALELKRTELLAKFAPDYRPVQEVDTQIAQTRDALTTAEKSQLHDETTDRDPAHEVIREELAKATADLASLQTRAAATAAIVQSYEQNYQSLEPKEVVHDDLIRTVKATEENYLLYLRKAEEARISDALDRKRIINVAIAEAATVPSLPANRRSATVLVGLLLATMVSVGLAFGSEYLDSTVRTPHEVKLFLSVPLLATVPKSKTNGTAASRP
jgi:uncharacterized protein involved in exopolysaccharide biosynthesis